jgi:hypothetical protein
MLKKTMGGTFKLIALEDTRPARHTVVVVYGSGEPHLSLSSDCMYVYACTYACLPIIHHTYTVATSLAVWILPAAADDECMMMAPYIHVFDDPKSMHAL